MNWNSIPQLFSNLIGQVLPGLVLLVLLWAVIVGPTEALQTLLDAEAQRRVLSIGPVVVLLLLSQAVGMLCSQLWTSTIGKLMRRAEARTRRRSVAERLKEHNLLLTALRYPTLPASADDLPEPFVMHDHLHLVAKQEATRLLKVRAERRLCHALAFGTTLLALLNLCLCIRGLSADRIGLETILVVIAIGCTLRSLRLAGMLTNGIVATWLCLASEQQLPFQKAANPKNAKAADGKTGK